MLDLDRKAMAGTGHLVVFEGVDGVGKTTLVNRVAAVLGDCLPNVRTHSFPGTKSGTLGELVYRVHHSATLLRGVPPLALQMLHVAAHLDAIINDILPDLRVGTVLLDRYWWSTLAYGICSNVDAVELQTILGVEKRCWGGTRPTIAFLIHRNRNTRDGDERERRLCSAYVDIVESESVVHPIQLLDNNRSIDDAVDQVINRLRDHGVLGRS